MALIAALGGIGAYAFLASSAYDAVRNFGDAHKIAFMGYLPLIIWGIITAFGILNIVLANRGSGSFIWLVMIFSLPSLLAHNTVDWPKIFGWSFKLTTSLGFNSMLALSVLTITGYVILDYLRFFKQSGNSMKERQVSPTDIENVSNFRSTALFLAVLSALAATALVACLAILLEKAALGFMQSLPWNVVFVGLFCLLLIAFYLYWLFARRRNGTENSNNLETLTKSPDPVIPDPVGNPTGSGKK
jgi:hypothetical protein